MAASWNAADGKWEVPANWVGGVLPSFEETFVTNGGIARIDSDSGNLVVGPTSGASLRVQTDSTLEISGGELRVRTGFFNSALLDISGGFLMSTNNGGINGNGEIRISGGQVVVGSAVNKNFKINESGLLHYTGGEIDIAGDLNINNNNITGTTIHFDGLVGSGDFNAINIGRQFWPGQTRLKISPASGAVISSMDAFVLFSYKSGSWKGTGNDHYFRDDYGNLIDNFNWTGDPIQEDTIFEIAGHRFQLCYNANLDAIASSQTWNLVNTGNYTIDSSRRYVVLISVDSFTNNAVRSEWDATDGKWENAANWTGGSPASQDAVVSNGGTARIDGTSGSVVVGSGAQASLLISSRTSTGTVAVAGGELKARGGIFVGEPAMPGVLDISGGTVCATNGVMVNNGILNLSGGQLEAGSDAGFLNIVNSGTLNYSGGELTAGKLNNDWESQPTAALNFVNLVGGGDFNAIKLTGSLTPAQNQLGLTFPENASFNEKDAYVLFEFSSGSWGGDDDDHYFRTAAGELIEDFNWKQFGDAAQSNAVFEINGVQFYLDYNVNLSDPDFSTYGYNLVNTGNYTAATDTRQVVLFVIGVKGFYYDDFSTLYSLTEGPEGDDDSDGRNNLYEFALNGNPTDPADLGVEPDFRTLEENGTNVLEYVHLKRLNSGLKYDLELTPNLVIQSWTNTGYEVVGESRDMGDGFSSVTNHVFTEDATKFIRLFINNPQ